MTISVPGVTETDLALLVRDVIIHFAPRMDRLENSLLALCFPMIDLAGDSTISHLSRDYASSASGEKRRCDDMFIINRENPLEP